MDNYMEVRFKAISSNEGFARLCVASFCLQLNPTVDELTDIKTAVSEAVTNCVVHAYPHKKGDVMIRAEVIGDEIEITVSDEGIGIKNFKEAMEPFFTTKPDEERSGMGFAVMESFMDEVHLEKNGERGLKVILRKKIRESAMVAGGEC